MKQASLPDWAKANCPGKIEIDAEKFYPEIIIELWDDENWPDKKNIAAKGKPENLQYADKMYNDLQRTEIDQYWVETAFQVAKLDVQSAVSGTELMPDKGGALLIIVKDGSKSANKGVSKWQQKSLPKGRGCDAASKGKEARSHYERIRNLLL